VSFVEPKALRIEGLFVKNEKNNVVLLTQQSRLDYVVLKSRTRFGSK